MINYSKCGKLITLKNDRRNNMKKKLNNEIYEADEISNYRELVNRSAEKYPNNVAYT